MGVHRVESVLPWGTGGRGTSLARLDVCQEGPRLWRPGRGWGRERGDPEPKVDTTVGRTDLRSPQSTPREQTGLKEHRQVRVTGDTTDWEALSVVSPVSSIGGLTTHRGRDGFESRTNTESSPVQILNCLLQNLLLFKCM